MKQLSFTLSGYLILMAFTFESSAQVVRSDKGDKIKMHTFKAKRTNDVKIYRNVLYDMTDTSLVVVDAHLLQVILEDWKTQHQGALPSADSLSKVHFVHHYPFQSLEWVDKNKLTKWGGAMIGIVALGGIANAIITFSGNPEYPIISLLAYAFPLSIVGGGVGAIVVPKGKIMNNPQSNFKETITQKWQKYTITEQLRKVVSTSVNEVKRKN